MCNVSRIENIIFARFPGATFNSQSKNHVLNYAINKRASESQPTEKPVKKLNRRYIGFEINPDYVEMANARIKNLEIIKPNISDKVYKDDNNSKTRSTYVKQSR